MLANEVSDKARDQILAEAQRPCLGLWILS